MITDAHIAALADARFTARLHAASGRWYLKCDGKDAGYVTDADADGSTGTCGNVTRRAGSAAAALRTVAL
jgi:hypothetical protein